MEDLATAPSAPPPPPRHGWPGYVYIATSYLGAVLFTGLGVVALVTTPAPAGVFLMLVCGAAALAMYYLGRGVARFHPFAFWLALVGAAVQLFYGVRDLSTIDPSGIQAFFRVISLGLAVIYLIYFVHRWRDFFRRSEAR